MIGAIVGEFIGGEGLGSVVDVARTQQRVDKVFAAVLLASVLGLGLFGVINLMSAMTLKRWHASEQAGYGMRDSPPMNADERGLENHGSSDVFGVGTGFAGRVREEFQDSARAELEARSAVWRVFMRRRFRSIGWILISFPGARGRLRFK